MSQKLILPINDCAFSAGYKNAAYKKQQGYTHYGVDLYSNSANTSVFSPGNGVVIAAGLDGSSYFDKLGWCYVIVFPDVILPSGSIKGLSCRMFHFNDLLLKAGNEVKQGQLLGHYGNSGGTLVNGNRMGKHLHIEFDTDVGYPRHAVGIARSGKVILKGTLDSTVNPSDVWYRKENQNIKGIYDGWYSTKDIKLPVLGGE